MGRIKELYMELLHANDGEIPHHITIGDIKRMKDMEASEWKAYEEQEKKKGINHEKNI